MSLELDENQLALLKWVKNHTGNGKSPVIVFDNLSNLAELGDDNSAGHMQSFNMIVTKAIKVGCSLVIFHHTGKTLNLGPDGVPTWRGSYDMAKRLDKTICLNHPKMIISSEILKRNKLNLRVFSVMQTIDRI